MVRGAQVYAVFFWNGVLHAVGIKQGRRFLIEYKSLYMRKATRNSTPEWMCIEGRRREHKCCCHSVSRWSGASREGHLNSAKQPCNPMQTFWSLFSSDFLGSCANVREIRFEATFVNGNACRSSMELMKCIFFVKQLFHGLFFSVGCRLDYLTWNPM